MQVQRDLEERRLLASRNKIPLKMDQAEALRLKEVLLQISKISMKAFDCIDEDQISEHDTYLILQLPEFVNAFSHGIEAHARRRILEGQLENG